MNLLPLKNDLMPIYEIFKKQVFVTSRIIKADSKEDAFDKFCAVSATIDTVTEDGNFDEEIDVEERNDYDESAVSYCESVMKG